MVNDDQSYRTYYLWVKVAELGGANIIFALCRARVEIGNTSSHGQRFVLRGISGFLILKYEYNLGAIEHGYHLNLEIK